jgi:electron transport complex protein RnfD
MSFRDLPLYNRPLLNLSRSSAERLLLVSISALLAITQSALSDAGSTLFIALAALLAATVAELGINYLKSKPGIHNYSVFVSALIITLLLPNTINPVIAAVAVVFAITVVKETFGGFGSNWLNPALGGWLFVRLCWPEAFLQAGESSPFTFISQMMSEAPSGAGENNPIAILNSNGFGAGNGDMVTSFLQKNIFSFINIELPSNYFDFFINPGTGMIADRGVFGLLLGSMLLIAARVNRFILSVVYLVIYLLLVHLAGALPFAGPPGSGDMLFCLLSGGTLVAAFLLAADPVTGPKSAPGKVFSLMCAALLSFFFRYIKAEISGAIIAIACINTLTPLIRKIEERIFYEKSLVRGPRFVISITRSSE